MTVYNLAKVDIDWKHNFLIRILLSGFLLGVGFFIPWVWWISFIALLPILFGNFLQSRNPALLFLYGWLMGMVLYGIALWGFFWSTIPLTWYGIDSLWGQIAAVAANWILTAGSLAVGTGIFFIAVKYLWRNKPSDLFVIPLLWAVCEYVGSLWFDAVFFGPGSLVGGQFTLGHIGYLLANDTVLLQLAWLGGVYLLSFFVIFVNILIYKIGLLESKKIPIAISLGVAAPLYASVFLALALAPHTEGREKMTILAMSRAIPAELDISPQEGRTRSLATLDQLQGQSAALLLLPEGAALTKYLTLQERAKLLSQFPAIVDEQIDRESSSVSFSRASILYQNKPQTFKDKEFPLPVGEYMPYLHRFLLNALSTSFKEQVLFTRSVKSGTFQNFVEMGDMHLSVRFCNEVIAPSLYAGDARRGATIFTNIASHGWFHGSAFVYKNMQNAAKVRAVESRRWYVQASNMVPAFAIDPYGRVIAESIWGSAGILTVNVESRSDTTAYTMIRGLF